MRNSTQHLLQRLSLWVLGQALPETGALRAPARLAVMSVVVAAAAGTLIALGVVAGLIGLYLYLTQEGLSVGASLGLVAALGIMAGFVAYLSAKRSVEAIPDQLDELKLFSGHSQDIIGNAFNLLVGGFFEGVSDKTEAAVKKGRKSRAQIESAIEDLIEQLDLLETDFEDEVEEIADKEVVLEIKPKRAAPKRR